MADIYTLTDFNPPKLTILQRVIGAAMQVHKILGPGFVESIYENAFAIEMHNRGIPFSQQAEAPVMYEGVEVGRHRLDFLVAKLLVVELKAITYIEPIHFVQVRSYLRATGQPEGLLLNFSQTTLQIKKVGPRGPRGD